MNVGEVNSIFIEHKTYNLVLNEIIPGDGDQWPCISDVLKDEEVVEFGMNIINTAQKCKIDIEIDDLERKAIDFLKEIEQRNPIGFGVLLKALYAAYYTSASVQEAIRQLADGGPREALPYFDDTLLPMQRKA